MPFGATVHGSVLTHGPLDWSVEIDSGDGDPASAVHGDYLARPRCRGGRSVATLRQYDAPLRDRRPEHRIRRVTEASEGWKWAP